MNVARPPLRPQAERCRGANILCHLPACTTEVLNWRLCDLSRTVIYVPAVVCQIGATTMTPNPSPTRAMQTWPESCRSSSTVSCMGRATSAWTTLMKCWPRNCRHAPGDLHHAAASLLPTVACILSVQVSAAVPSQIGENGPCGSQGHVEKSSSNFCIMLPAPL